MYWVGFSGYIVHILVIYLQCTCLVHHPLPPVGGVKVLELIPIDLDLNAEQVKKAEGYNSCRCGQASHPILLSSDDNVSVAENAIPIRIQVEHSPPAD